ncbi:MAG: glycosyl transferase family 1 [Hyphomicrobiales bacterium]|nr:MAG: glycosyl transferase family 1 [Hyphomicrobiales bacterium]
MLTINTLTFRMAGRLLLEDASLTVPGGTKIGLVGKNGTGKTTLFKLITRDLAPESGSISLVRNARVGQVAQEAPGGPDTLLEFVLMADKERTALLTEAETATDPDRISDIYTRLSDIDAYSAESRAGTILSGLGFDAEAQQLPCSDFSGGWRMRVALAAVLFSEPDLLLLDEPTNYLDLEGTLWLQAYLKKYPHTIIIISHDRELLNASVEMIAHLEHRKITTYRGGYDVFEKTRREKQVLLEKGKVKHDAARKHMEAFVERFRYTASKARQAQSRIKALEKMGTATLMLDETSLPIRFPPPEKTLAPPIMHFDRVSVGYTPGQPVLKNISQRIDDDDRIGLLGQNGNGKSTFAKLLAGRLQADDGEITRAPKLKIAYFAQHQLDELIPSQSAFEHVRPLMPKVHESKVRARVAQMGLGADKMDTKVEQLSGGEKARLMLGLATFDGPHLLILDEPTNHLDIDSRQALVQALTEYPGAVVIVSHDRSLLNATVDKLWLVADGTIAPFMGDLDDYRRYILSGKMPNVPMEKSAPQKQVSSNQNAQERRKDAAQKRQSLAPLRKKIKGLESDMSKLNQQIKAAETGLADPDLYSSDPAKVTLLTKSRSSAEKLLITTEEKWLACTEELEVAQSAAG